MWGNCAGGWTGVQCAIHGGGNVHGGERDADHAAVEPDAWGAVDAVAAGGGWGRLDQSQVSAGGEYEHGGPGEQWAERGYECVELHAAVRDRNALFPEAADGFG